MADPYWRYSNTVGGAPAEGGSVVGLIFRGICHLKQLHQLFIMRRVLVMHPSIICVKRCLLCGLGDMDDINGVRVSSEPIIEGLTAGASTHSYSTSLDSILLDQGRDRGLGPSLGIQDVLNEPTSFLVTANGHPVVPGESNKLFVDGLPSNCTRREVGHLFRPFIGFKEIRVVHKVARHRRDKAMVLCFVEFDDAKCALTAMEALQSYKFDDKKPDSPSLKISFAHFPFQPPPDFQKERGSVRQQSRKYMSISRRCLGDSLPFRSIQDEFQGNSQLDSAQ